MIVLPLPSETVADRTVPQQPAMPRTGQDFAEVFQSGQTKTGETPASARGGDAGTGEATKDDEQPAADHDGDPIPEQPESDGALASAQPGQPARAVVQDRSVPDTRRDIDPDLALASGAAGVSRDLPIMGDTTTDHVPPTVSERARMQPLPGERSADAKVPPAAATTKHPLAVQDGRAHGESSRSSSHAPSGEDEPVSRQAAQVAVPRVGLAGFPDVSPIFLTPDSARTGQITAGTEAGKDISRPVEVAAESPQPTRMGRRAAGQDHFLPPVAVLAEGRQSSPPDPADRNAVPTSAPAPGHLAEAKAPRVGVTEARSGSATVRFDIRQKERQSATPAMPPGQESLGRTEAPPTPMVASEADALLPSARLQLGRESHPAAAHEPAYAPGRLAEAKVPRVWVTEARSGSATVRTDLDLRQKERQSATPAMPSGQRSLGRTEAPRTPMAASAADALLPNTRLQLGREIHPAATHETAAANRPMGEAKMPLRPATIPEAGTMPPGNRSDVTPEERTGAPRPTAPVEAVGRAQLVPSAPLAGRADLPAPSSDERVASPGERRTKRAAPPLPVEPGMQNGRLRPLGPEVRQTPVTVRPRPMGQDRANSGSRPERSDGHSIATGEYPRMAREHSTPTKTFPASSIASDDLRRT